MSNNLLPVLTRVGLEAVFDIIEQGGQAHITQVALGDEGWTPDDQAIQLRHERNRIPISNSERINATQLHLTAVESGSVEYWVREVGFLLEDGTLLAIWSDPDRALAWKAGDVDLLLVFDLILSALPADSVVVDGTGGLNLAPATQEKEGVVRLATAAEMTAGTATTPVPAVNTVADYVTQKLAELVDSSPAALDTLNELAAALGNDPQFATTVSTELGTKASITYVNQRLPAGVIVMWSGSVDRIPTGWALCNGANGTPDLRDRFVVGAGNGYTPGETGGKTQQETSSSGFHSHLESSAGQHNHGGVTAGHRLTVEEMPSHSHDVIVDVNYNVAGNRAASANDSGPYQTAGTSFTGGDQPHRHGVDGDGSHTHEIYSSGNHSHRVDMRPPYYALAYIMRL